MAEAVADLEQPSVPHSVVVEVEEDRVCVTRTTGPYPVSRLAHTVGARDAAALVETVIALAYQLTAEPDNPGGTPDVVEVNGGRGITEYPQRWQQSVEFIVGETPPGMPSPKRQPLVDRLRSRGFLTFEVPAGILGEAPSDEPFDPLTPVDAPGTLDLTEDSDADRPTGTTSSATRSLVAIGALTVGVFFLVVLAMVLPEGSKPVLTTAAGPNTERVAPSGAQVPSASASESSPMPVVANGASELESAGIAVSMPPGWRLDETSPLDRLIAIDGGSMRVVAVAYPLADGAVLEHIVAGLTSHATVNATMSVPVRVTMYDTEMVTVEERPHSGQSVVLWHHKIIDGIQVSVGCQFRGSKIPLQRPACDSAVRSAKPV
nr:type VII secretion-associated protein [Corynebacterium lactis]